MENTVTVEVTQEDIDNGEAENAQHCAIALACRRVFPGRSIQVYNTIGVYGGIQTMSYRLSKEAKKFINDFDNENEVKPFTFVATLNT